MQSPGYEVREVPLDRIRFAYSRVRPVFSGCGRRLEDTIAALVEGTLTPDALPAITCIAGGHAPASNDGHDSASDDDGGEGGHRRGRGGKKRAGGKASKHQRASRSTADPQIWYFSLNNRRLYCLKAWADAGGAQTVTVRVRAAKEHERERYTIDRCVLRARIAGLSTKQQHSSAHTSDAHGESTEDKSMEGTSVQEIVSGT